MTIDEAIAHCKEVADGCSVTACEADHRQLAEWLRELKERRLSAQLEQTDCEYCHEDRDGFIRPIEKNSHAFVSFRLDGWHIVMRANGWVGRAPIKFCPMCGRRLTDD